MPYICFIFYHEFNRKHQYLYKCGSIYHHMEALEAAGLTKNESKIYKLLIHLNKSNVTDLAKKTGIHRRSIYDVLMRLSDKGLVSYIIADGFKVYIANNPKILKTIIEKRKSVIDEALPDLEKIFQENAQKKSTKFFMGKKGIRNILDDQLNQKSEILVLGGSKYAPKLLREYFPKYNIIRSERKIPLKIIYSGHAKTENKIEAEKPKLAKTKKLPENIGGDIAINIYGDNVALLMWNLDNPFAILIHEKEVADSFRDYFNFIWRKL